MLKKLLIILGILMVILTIAFLGGGYYAYQHRQELTQKALNYAMQNMGKSLLSTNISATTAQTNSAKNSDSGLVNLLSMFAEGKDENDTAALIQMAGQAISSLSGNFNIHTKENVSVNDINARDKKGRTLLMNVCRTDATAIVIKMLLQYGADVSARDNRGRTALMYAVALNQNHDVIKLLIASGADVKAFDNESKTVSDYAANQEIQAIILNN